MSGFPTRRALRGASPFAALLCLPMPARAELGSGPELFGIPFDFFLFAATLIGVALFHKHTLRVALTGLAVVTLYKLGFTGFKSGDGLPGLFGHIAHEWVIITNLFGLLVGFALLSNHFERSHLPQLLPRFLPDGWKGAFALLVMIWVMSGFLDNIAAALIGGTLAATLFRRKLHIGYLAAIVAASNAGGAGSVVGDTTTTMMWIDGVSPFDVLHAYVAAVTALLIFGTIAAVQQHRLQPIQADADPDARIDWTCLGIVGFILVSAISVNVFVNVNHPELASRFPFIGVAVWVAIALVALLRRPDWHEVPPAARGAVFLLALVLCA
ncbi:MAG: SLC13 family permease, partial [Betaproteobacteria bacterium]